MLCRRVVGDVRLGRGPAPRERQLVAVEAPDGAAQAQAARCRRVLLLLCPGHGPGCRSTRSGLLCSPVLRAGLLSGVDRGKHVGTCDGEHVGRKADLLGASADVDGLAQQPALSTTEHPLAAARDARYARRRPQAPVLARLRVSHRVRTPCDDARADGGVAVGTQVVRPLDRGRHGRHQSRMPRRQSRMPPRRTGCVTRKERRHSKLATQRPLDACSTSTHTVPQR